MFLLASLQSLDPLWVALLSLAIYSAFLLVFFKLWGETGIYVYMAIAIIGANLQVLKVSYFALFANPIALGTSLFSTLYLASDLLSEYFGQRSAYKGIAIAFAALLLWTVITFLLLAFAPLTPHQAQPSYAWALNTHDAMSRLFSPTPAILCASLAAFALSQLNDVAIYTALKRYTQGKYLFLRNNLSTFLSTLIDNTVFALIAFVLLSSHPIPLRELIIVYIFGTYSLRLLYALLDTPFIYLARCIVPRPHQEFFPPHEKSLPSP